MPSLCLYRRRSTVFWESMYSSGASLRGLYLSTSGAGQAIDFETRSMLDLFLWALMSDICTGWWPPSAVHRLWYLSNTLLVGESHLVRLIVLCWPVSRRRPDRGTTNNIMLHHHWGNATGLVLLMRRFLRCRSSAASFITRTAPTTLHTGLSTLNIFYTTRSVYSHHDDHQCDHQYLRDGTVEQHHLGITRIMITRSPITGLAPACNHHPPTNAI